MKKLISWAFTFVLTITIGHTQNTFPNPGNVGIGTTSPGSLLTLNSPSYPIEEFQLNNQTKFIMTVAGGPNYWAPGAATGDFVFRSSANMLFTTNNGNSTVMAINPSGNVGIGTLSPSTQLAIGSYNTNNPNNTGAEIPYSSITFQNNSNNTNFNVGRIASVQEIGGYIDAGAMVFSTGYGTLGEKMRITGSGNVLIGMTSASANYKLNIAGGLRANNVTVNTSGADFVFASKYHLPSLKTVNTFISANHHLPNITSAKQMQNEGLNLGEMNRLLLQKVEELTLYLINEDNNAKKQAMQLKTMQEELLLLKKQLAHVTPVNGKCS